MNRLSLHFTAVTKNKAKAEGWCGKISPGRFLFNLDESKLNRKQ